MGALLCEPETEIHFQSEWIRKLLELTIQIKIQKIKGL